MPPSGFNEKAIRGLLQFVEGCYEDLLDQVSDKSEPKAVTKAINNELADIRAALESFSLDSVKKPKKNTKATAKKGKSS